MLPGFKLNNELRGSSSSSRAQSPTTSDHAQAGPSSTHSSPSQLPYLRDPGHVHESPEGQPRLKKHEGEVDTIVDGGDTETPRPAVIPTPNSSTLLGLPSLQPTASTSAAAGPSSSSLSPTLSATSSNSTNSKRVRKRPVPLVLGRREIGQDEELTAQLQADGRWSAKSPLTVISRRSSGPDEMEFEFTHTHTPDSQEGGRSPGLGDLSGLRLGDDRPGPDFVDLASPRSFPASETTLPPLPASAYASLADLPPSSSTRLIIDPRPLATFLASHIAGSVNINIPSLIYKRLRKSGGIGATSNILSGYITTAAGRAGWDIFMGEPDTPVFILGVTDEEQDETARVFKSMVDRFAKSSRVKILRGGWQAVLAQSISGEGLELVSGDEGVKSGQPLHGLDQNRSMSYPPPLTTSSPSTYTIPTFHIAPPDPHSPPGPSNAQGSLAHKQSMPSLRTGIKRNVPNLSIQVHGPKLARPPRSASAVTGKFPNLHLDIAAAKGAGGSLGPKSPGRSPVHGSFQQACLEQSKLPPSPSTFADITLPTPARGPWTSKASGSDQGHAQTLNRGFGVGARTGPARNAVAPFIISTILPAFLYLGPEISSMEEVRQLQRMGIKRILNVAVECEDNQGLGLANEFEKYHKIPMRDIVEETGVKRHMWEACDFLNDARLHSAPVYVHCKAGKSRSVTVVLAYLIHANAWTLKTAYAYVAEHRKGISPNIGFVAELMQFEETELGLKQSGGVHGDVPQPNDNKVDSAKGEEGSSAGTGSGSAGGKQSTRRRQKHLRESLPPAWAMGSASLGHAAPRLLVSDDKDKGDGQGGGDDSLGPKRDQEERGKDRKVTDEREVRKNGHWVQQRRAPVDRTTLQPGRRASKAGLESLRPISTDTDKDVEGDVSLGTGDKRGKVQAKGAFTPGGEGPLKWV